MKKLVLLFMMAISLPAHAQVTGALGTSLIFENASDGRNIEMRQPLNVRAGYRFKPVEVYGEYATFQTSQGAAMISVARRQHEFLLWAKRRIPMGWRVLPFASLGAGTHYEDVTTTLGSESAKDSGTAEVLLAAATGLEFRFHRNLDLQLEGRVASAANYSPNPLFGFSLFLGFRY